jgi:hypothetical protein
MYDIEFSSDIYCNLTKIDFDNLINIINDIRYSLKNNFTKNLNQNNIGNNINNNNFLRLFKMKIQKIECNFIIASIFRLKNDSEIKLTLNDIIINKEKPNNYTYLIEEISVIRYIKNNNNNILNIYNDDNNEEILFKIPRSNNAIYLSYENIKNEKKRLIDFVIDKIIFNIQYELLFDFLNFFINVKYNNIYYQNNNKEIINCNIENNSNIPNNTINSSFSNNTILSINTLNKENINFSDNKNSNSNNEIQDNNIKKEKRTENNSENTSDFMSFQLVPKLLLNFNINSLLLKFPIKQQKTNINLMDNEINDKKNDKKSNFEKEEDENNNENNQIQFFCIELI